MRNSSSHPNAIEIDQNSGTLGIGTLNQHVPHVGHDAQLLPAHLKCGMWASLALATVFVAGAKFYFDHQGTGLEVLIFCAFSATFFLAACTVSLCRRPRDMQMPVNNVISETISNGDQNSLQNNPDLVSGTPATLLNGSLGGTQQNSLGVLAPPPPYHIAILLPESAKETDETPPPSYDKIVI
ncbi:AAEL002579-PA [Aedes aegypti]|uniref:AAEL002579-PA n=1 Tax=Aedes aegypti TaxID=7159 RepID=Q17HR4_AEDAE|nr:AAEL002579-PA [Aedes aegypti]